MTANPDALRRAADEMDALITRQAAHLADIERLTAERAHIHESARERARKLNEVRFELRRAGYPVDEGDWPTDALRQLVDAYLELKANPWSDAPITMALCSLLGDCRPAEIVERVRNMKFDLGLAKGKHDSYYHHLARLREVLDAANAGHPDGTLVERVRAIAAERDTALSRAYRLESILAEHNGDKAPDDYAAFLRDLLTTLTGERDDLARRLEAAELDRAGLVAKTDVLRRERDGARDELAKLRAAKPAVEWRGRDLFANGEFASGLVVGQPWRLLLGTRWIGHATDEASARRLAELLAGHDPGGVWRVAGEPVTVAVVRAVCPTVAVSWGPA